VRGAANLLHVSPGALSKALAFTEQEVGQELFARVGRGMELTDAGRRFHARAMKVIADYDALAKPETTPAPAELRVGSFEVFTTHLLGHVVANTKEVPLVVLELVPGPMEEAVRDGIVDFGITYAPVAMSGVAFIDVGELQMGIFGRPRFARTSKFEEWPFAVPITRVGGHVAGFQSLDGWPTSAPARLIRYRCEMLETALVLARNEAAVLHCPSFVVSLANRTSIAPLSELQLPKKMKPVTATVYLVKRASEPETAALKTWARTIQSVMRE
jgi:DNA-binding transcriptional LysR family regulator